MRISIIIPVYNSEAFLKNCLLSICHQTYSDFDCILVNDGSSDRSGQICDEWSKLDSRFRVIHQTNKGVSQARNTALSQCNTQWITFVDSDDWLNEDYLAFMVNETSKHPDAEIIISSSLTHYGDKISEHCLMRNAGCHKFDNQSQHVINELLEKYKIMAPWGKLYKKSIIDRYNVQFPADVSYGEDLIFNITYFSCIECFAIAKSAIYNYIVRDGSLSKKVKDTWKTNYPQWVKLFDLFQAKNIDSAIINETLFKMLWDSITESIFNSKYLGLSFKEEYKYIKSILSMPEIDDKRFRTCDSNCSEWIKYIIMNRYSLVFAFINHFLIQTKNIKE